MESRLLLEDALGTTKDNLNTSSVTGSTLNAKINAATYASSAFDTNKGRGFTLQRQQRRAHEFCDA